MDTNYIILITIDTLLIGMLVVWAISKDYELRKIHNKLKKL